MVAQAHWVLQHGSGWRYEEIRPIPLANIKAGRLPVHTDCSGSVIGIAYRAGVPDPSGYRYAGYGNTDSLSHHCEHLNDYHNAMPGDLVNVESPSDHDSTHVYLVLEHHSNGDATVFSHGGPDGTPPSTKLLSAVHSYWYGRGYVFVGLRWLPIEQKPKYRWHVLNGRGKLIGRTNHPGIYASRHPKQFRAYDQVRYVDMTQ
jgi:hypothetical protein